jgi:hypothetical protein
MSPRPNLDIVHSGMLDEIRGVANKARPDTAQITRPAHTTDAGGGSTVTYPTIATTAVRVVPLSRMRPSEREVASRSQGERLVVLAFAHGTDVQLKDRVVISGHTYEVVDDVAAGHSYEAEVRMLASEVGV